MTESSFGRVLVIRSGRNLTHQATTLRLLSNSFLLQHDTSYTHPPTLPRLPLTPRHIDTASFFAEHSRRSDRLSDSRAQHLGQRCLSKVSSAREQETLIYWVCQPGSCHVSDSFGLHCVGLLERLSGVRVWSRTEKSSWKQYNTIRVLF